MLWILKARGRGKSMKNEVLRIMPLEQKGRGHGPRGKIMLGEG
jgi:hypothetical protein